MRSSRTHCRTEKLYIRCTAVRYSGLLLLAAGEVYASLESTLSCRKPINVPMNLIYKCQPTSFIWFSVTDKKLALIFAFTSPVLIDVNISNALRRSISLHELTGAYVTRESLIGSMMLSSISFQSVREWELAFGFWLFSTFSSGYVTIHHSEPVNFSENVNILFSKNVSSTSWLFLQFTFRFLNAANKRDYTDFNSSLIVSSDIGPMFYPLTITMFCLPWWQFQTSDWSGSHF